MRPRSANYMTITRLLCEYGWTKKQILTLPPRARHLFARLVLYADDTNWVHPRKMKEAMWQQGTSMLRALVRERLIYLQKTGGCVVRRVA